MSYVICHAIQLSDYHTIRFVSYYQAEGEVSVTEMRAKAQAEAIRVIAEVLQGDNASDAAKLAIAREVSPILLSGAHSVPHISRTHSNPPLSPIPTYHLPPAACHLPPASCPLPPASCCTRISVHKHVL
jgi:hypothetical protein